MTARSPNPSAAQRPSALPLKTALIDIYRGVLDVSHNGLALLGTAIAVAAITLFARADLRADAEQQLLGWLLQRQEATMDEPLIAVEPTAIDRVSQTREPVADEIAGRCIVNVAMQPTFSIDYIRVTLALS